jgi:septation ring formation regulator EzrA
MADNAIDKLFEEMRATAEELAAIQTEEEALQEQLRDLRKRHVAAIKHRDVLDVTLRKHIHTGMPVVQAKMVAHEELEHSRNASTSAMSRTASVNSAPVWSIANAANSASAAVNSASSASTNAANTAVNVQLASMGAAIFKGNRFII